MMYWLIFHLCTATASALARNGAAAALASDAAVVQRGTPGYEALLERNWVGNVQFNSAAAIVPASLDELRNAVRGAQASASPVDAEVDACAICLEKLQGKYTLVPTLWAANPEFFIFGMASQSTL